MMIPDKFYIKEGTTWPPLVATLYSGDSPLPLDDVEEILFYMSRKKGSVKINGAPCVIIEAGGIKKVQYNWTPNDTSEPGNYVAEYKITYSNGKTQRVPSGDEDKLYSEIIIYPRLGTDGEGP